MKQYYRMTMTVLYVYIVCQLEQDYISITFSGVYGHKRKKQKSMENDEKGHNENEFGETMSRMRVIFIYILVLSPTLRYT